MSVSPAVLSAIFSDESPSFRFPSDRIPAILWRSVSASPKAALPA